MSTLIRLFFPPHPQPPPLLLPPGLPRAHAHPRPERAQAASERALGRGARGGVVERSLAVLARAAAVLEVVGESLAVVAVGEDVDDGVDDAGAPEDDVGRDVELRGEEST